MTRQISLRQRLFCLNGFGRWLLGVGLVMLSIGQAEAQSWKPVVTPGAVKQAGASLSILFVGNSHMLMPGFVDRVVRRVKGKSKPGRSIQKRVVAMIGTTLTKTRKQAETLRVLRGTPWDVVVLQESTTAFMTKPGRRNFMAAVRWFRKHKRRGTKLLLWQAWPQGRKHALYHRRGVWGKWFKNPPRSPKQLFSWIEQTSGKVAQEYMVGISPIGSCWMRLPAKKRPYARDGYHVGAKGQRFIAEVLARSIVATASGSAQKASWIRGDCP